MLINIPLEGLTMWLSGMLTAVGFVFIVGKFSTNALERMLGNLAVIIDIVMTFGVMLLFGSTGTISGMMTAITTGLCISVILLIVKNFGHYQDFEKLEDGSWGWSESKAGKWRNVVEVTDYLASITKQGKATVQYICGSLKESFSSEAPIGNLSHNMHAVA